MKTILQIMRSRKFLSLISFTIALIVCTLWIIQELRSQDSSLTGFRIREVRFDESTGDKLPTPTIPSSWKFIGVSNGEKINTNSLWFQDKDGNVLLVTGFYSWRGFVLDKDIQKISSQK